MFTFVKAEKLFDVKAEKLFDWNANETPTDSPNTYTPSEQSVETGMNAVEDFTDKADTIPAKRKVNKPHVEKQKIPFRKKVCTSVPVNHFGPISGIPVGTCWEKRIQVSESGVHRPPVAGIHGREHEGAYSIVFSGTYAEDKDFGDEFYYSGCGGGVTDPHKLISGQVCDQTLTCHNKALAVSCNAPVNDQVGAEAGDWQAGKPIRVIRTHKLRKHSEFAPEEGNRYDGIYKVVKYFPTIGQCGLLVWRFLLRRDDPEPAPWTDEGKQAIAEKNLQMIRAAKTDYVQTVYKKDMKKKNVKRSPRKSSPENSVYPFPDEETFQKIITDSLRYISEVQDGETKSASDNRSIKLKLKKSGVQKSTKRTSKTNSPKFCSQNTVKNQEAKPNLKKRRTQSKHLSFQFLDEEASKKMIDLEMGLATTNADSVHVNPDSDPLITNGMPKSPRKRNRKQKPNEFLNTDSCEYICYPFFDMENVQEELANAQMNYFVCPTSEMETNENNYDQSEVVEIVPDVSFLQVNTAPEPPSKRKSKSNIKVAPLRSLNRKNKAANCKTSRNKDRNVRRNRTTDAGEPLKLLQIDLTTEEDEPYVLPVQTEKSIDSDTLNKTIWDYCRKNFLKTESDFLDVVTLMFTCRYCNHLAANPVTTPCDHNLCLECISNHFLKKMYACPDCHNNLGPSFKIKENRNLANALEHLFPGYNLRY